MRKRTSPIWQMPSDEFKKLVEESSTYEQVLRGFGASSRGGGYFKTLKKRLAEENISTDHFKQRGQWSKKKASHEIFVENSTYNRSNIKKRALAEGLLREECYECGQKSVWMEKPLVLILDHINGVNNDHRPENLQMLCPNCNSQTDTFAGRNI
jgi:hypothetical protein